MVPYMQMLARARDSARDSLKLDMAEEFTQLVQRALHSAMPGSPVEFRFNRVMFSAFRPG